MMVEMTLLEAFEYQLANTKPPKHQPMYPGHIDDKGGLEYLRKLKNKGYLMKDAAKLLGCERNTVGLYCKKKGTKWSEL